jgi:hypothetical protein
VETGVTKRARKLTATVNRCVAPVGASATDHGALSVSIASTREQVDAIRPQWIRTMAGCGVEAADAVADLFTALLDVAGSPAQPYVVLFGNEEGNGGPRAAICGRTQRRCVTCRLGCLSLPTPKLRCLQIDDGGLFTDGSSAASHAVVRHLEELLGGRVIQHLAVNHLPCQHPAFSELSRNATVAIGPAVHCRLSIPRSFDELMKMFSAKHSYNLQRQDDLLVAHLGGKLTLREFDRAEQLDRFLTGAAAVAARTRQGGHCRALADDAHWRAVLGTEAKNGRFRGYWLEDEQDKPIAFQAGARWGNTYRLMASSFLPELRHLSPDTVLHIRVL